MGGLRRRAGTVRTGFGPVATFVAALVATVVGVSDARAQANAYLCNDLTARLASLSKMPASRADKWAGAIAEQRQAIAANQSQAQRCGASTDPRCSALLVRGEQMAANLAKLEREYGRLGGDRAAASPERARIEAAMAQAHCGERPSRSSASVAGAPPAGLRAASGEVAPGVGGSTIRTAPLRPPEAKRGFFSILFEGNRPEPAETQPTEVEPGTDPAGDQQFSEQMSGSYRTLCVRTCDGYYFPISFQASRGRLRTDANVCSALCPGTETRLYYHGTGQEAEQAIAADSGEPITRLPNAFLYRTKVVPGCACGRPDPRLLPAAAGGLVGRMRELARLIDQAGMPLPRPRPDPDQDPETQAAQMSGFDPQPVGRIEATAEGDAETVAAQAPATAPEAPKVRTVGPKFFSDR